MSYKITEVDGEKHADTLQGFNARFPDDFLPLLPRHFKDGFWWLVHYDLQIIGFAGTVPFLPFPRVGYFKRVGVLDSYRGRGVQLELTELICKRARASTDWTHIVSECSVENAASANNHFKAGFRLVEAERPWEKDTLFWRLKL